MLSLLNNNQLQLCWALNPNGTIAQESFTAGGFAPAAAQPITLAVSATPAIPTFEDELGNPTENATVFETTLTGEDDSIVVERLQNGSVRLSWEGHGHLESANVLLGNGPPTVWTDVPGGATSPVTVPGNAMKRFFRVHRY